MLTEQEGEKNYASSKPATGDVSWFQETRSLDRRKLSCWRKETAANRRRERCAHARWWHRHPQPKGGQEEENQQNASSRGRGKLIARQGARSGDKAASSCGRRREEGGEVYTSFVWEKCGLRRTSAEGGGNLYGKQRSVITFEYAGKVGGDM